MLKLDRYIGTSLLWSFFLTLLIITGLDLVAAFIDEVGKTRADYTIAEILMYLFLTLPGRFYEFTPFAVLIGSLLALGQFSSNSELIVMRASGMSVRGIVWAILKPVFLIAALASILGDLVIPQTDLRAENRRTLMLNKVGDELGKTGVWSREGNTFIHFETVNNNNEAVGITILNFDSNQSLRSALRAATGVFKVDRWLLFNVNRTDFSRWETKGVSLDSLEWNTSITPRLLLLDLVNPSQLGISDLYYYIGYLSAQGLDSGKFQLAFWRKLFFPFTLLSLVVMGASFIFGPLREGSVGFRVFIGVMTGVVFKVSQDLLGPSSLVFGFTPLLAALIPILGCLILGGILIMRAR